MVAGKHIATCFSVKKKKFAGHNPLSLNHGFRVILACTSFLVPVGPCTFPQFNFSSFYLYMEDLLGSNVNVARDRIQFVA